MVGVQLIGKNQVLGAYRNVDVECWSIFQHKNLLVKGKGESDLDQFLAMLAANATSTVYTIKFYEEIEDPKQIKEKTEASGSLNFRLSSSDYEGSGSEEYKGRYEYTRKLEERIGSLEKQLEGSNEPQSLEEAAIGLLANPGELLTVIAAVKELFRPNTPAAANGQPYQQRATVGHITYPQNNMGQDSDEQRLKRLQDAVTILEAADDKLVEHMEKLAKMAQQEPGKFKMLLSML